MNATPRFFNISKSHASILGIAIESKTLSLHDISAWVEDAVVFIHRPPYWLLDLASAQTDEEALAAIHGHCFGEPFEVLPDASDIFTSCLLLRHLRGDFGWPEFLRLAGGRNDGVAGRRECEYFYALLNAFEKSTVPLELEAAQKSEIAKEYSDELVRVRALIEDLKNLGRSTGHK